MKLERAAFGLALLTSSVALADPPERSWSVEARAGGGVDSNVLHDPQSQRQSGLARVDVTGELEAMRNLRVSLVGWFDEHLPNYELNEASVQLLLMFRKPLGRSVSLKVGSFSDYHRELSTFFEGTVFTHGAALVTEMGEHVSLGLEAQYGPIDLELGAAGHVRYVDGPQSLLEYDSHGHLRDQEVQRSFLVGGVSGHASARWVPTRWFSLRVRLLELFEDVHGLFLVGRNGIPTGVDRDLQLQTFQVDVAAHVRPVHALGLFVRYEFAAIDDDFLGYLYGQEHRVLAGLRYDSERLWVIDLFGKMVYRTYPLRVASIDNQASDLPFEAVADVELRLHKHVGVFVRYQFDGEAAAPFGLIYLRHSALAGVAARAGGKW